MNKLDNDDKSYYGVNTGWLCREAAISADDLREDYMIPDDIDVYVEDEHGRDSCASIDIPKLLMSAHMELKKAENLSLTPAQQHADEMYRMLQAIVNNDSISDHAIGFEIMELLAKARGEL